MKYLFALLLSFAGVVNAYQLDQLTVLSDDVVKVYDGDTFDINIPYVPDVFGKVISVRIKGVDTPEIKSECATKELRVKESALAAKARDVVLETLKTTRRVKLVQMERDKYFRLLATVYFDDVSISDLLISKGLGVPYTGGTKVGWCGK